MTPNLSRAYDPDYRLFFEAATDGMLAVSVDRTVLDANLAACRLLGRLRADLVATPLGDFFDPSYPVLEAAWEKLHSSGGFYVSTRLLRGDGCSFPADVTVSGSDSGGLGVVFRETGPRADEEERPQAKATAAGYRAMVEGAMDAMLVCNLDNTFRYVNPALGRILGYKLEELVGRFVPDIIHPEDLARAASLNAEIHNAHASSGPYEMRYRRKDGSWVSLETTLNNLADDPTVRGVVAVCRDVTERIEAEKALRGSEERHRALNENALDFVVVQRADNTLSYVSPSIERLLGWTPEEALGKLGADFIHPEDLEWAWPAFYKMLQTPGINETVTIRYRRKDGSWRWFESACNNQLGNPAVGGLVFNCRDVTERVEAEQKLREAEERYRLLVEQVPAVNYTLAPALADAPGTMTQGSVAYMSPRVRDVLGYQPETFLDDPLFWNSLVHPDDLNRVLAEDERTDRTGDPFEMEYRMRREDGKWVWVRDSAVLVRGDSGEPLLWQCVLVDITRQKSAEDEVRRLNEDLEQRVEQRTAQLAAAMDEAADNAEMLRLSGERFRALVRHGSDIITLLDPDGTVRYESPAIEKVLGYAPRDLDGRQILDYIHPDDTHRLTNVFREIRESRSVQVTAELRFKHGDGSWRFLECVVNNLLDEPGVHSIVVNSRDITERKGAEERLRRALDVLLALYEAGQLLGSTLNPDEVGPGLLEIMRRVSNLEAAVVHVQDERRNWHIWHTMGPEETWRNARRTPGAIATRWAALRAEKPRSFAMDPEKAQGRVPPVGICLPLRVRDRVMGVLEAYGPEDLLEEETVEILSSLTSQAASALENARLYEELTERERRLQDLVGRLLGAQEEERRRVAYEVHDGLAQTAAAAHHHLQAFANRHPATTARAREDLDRIVDLVRRTVDESRQVIAHLRPTELDDLGLAAALRLRVEKMREEGWLVDYEEKLGEHRLPATVEIVLYRAAQEALTNFRKHAGTCAVRLEVVRRQDTVTLEVRDEGRGFDPRSVAGSGPGERVGLSGIEERVNALGGNLVVSSQPEGGTTVGIEMPLPSVSTKGGDHAR